MNGWSRQRGVWKGRLLTGWFGWTPKITWIRGKNSWMIWWNALAIVLKTYRWLSWAIWYPLFRLYPCGWVSRNSTSSNKPIEVRDSEVDDWHHVCADTHCSPGWIVARRSTGQINDDHHCNGANFDVVCHSEEVVIYHSFYHLALVVQRNMTLPLMLIHTETCDGEIDNHWLVSLYCSFYSDGVGIHRSPNRDMVEDWCPGTHSSANNIVRQKINGYPSFYGQIAEANRRPSYLYEIVIGGNPNLPPLTEVGSVYVVFPFIFCGHTMNLMGGLDANINCLSFCSHVWEVLLRQTPVESRDKGIYFQFFGHKWMMNVKFFFQRRTGDNIPQLISDVPTSLPAFQSNKTFPKYCYQPKNTRSLSNSRYEVVFSI